MKGEKIILTIGITCIFIVFVCILYLTGISTHTKIFPLTPGHIPIQPTNTVKGMGMLRVGSNTVNLTANGFSPKISTIASGSRIIWVNISGSNATVNSDDYPTNKLYPPLNLGVFANTYSVSLVFDKPGTYSYHDQLHPQWTGSIVVQ